MASQSRPLFHCFSVKTGVLMSPNYVSSDGFVSSAYMYQSLEKRRVGDRIKRNEGVDGKL